MRILMTYAESSSEIFCLRFDHMVAIPMINTGPMNKKTAVKTKNGMLSEELSNDKLDMIRHSNFIKRSYWWIKFFRYTFLICNLLRKCAGKRVYFILYACYA